MAANECILMAILPKLPPCVGQPQGWMGARRWAAVAGGRGRDCADTSMSMVGLGFRCETWAWRGGQVQRQRDRLEQWELEMLGRVAAKRILLRAVEGSYPRGCGVEGREMG